MSSSHTANLCDDFGSLWAPKWVARAAEGTPKSSRLLPLGHFCPTVFSENMTARKACVNLAPCLWFPMQFWTAQLSIRCSLRSPNDVLPFWQLLQKWTRKTWFFKGFGTHFSWKSLILRCVAAKLMKKDSKLELCVLCFVWWSGGRVKYPKYQICRGGGA